MLILAGIGLGIGILGVAITNLARNPPDAYLGMFVASFGILAMAAVGVAFVIQLVT